MNKGLLTSIDQFSIGTVQNVSDETKELYLTGHFDGKIRNNNKLPFWRVISESPGRKTFSNTYFTTFLKKLGDKKLNMKMHIKYHDFKNDPRKTFLNINDIELDKGPTDNTLIISFRDPNNSIKEKILKDIDIDLVDVPLNHRQVMKG